jgi:plastocyanin
MEPVDIVPGTITEMTLLFDKPGIYTYYCTYLLPITPQGGMSRIHSKFIKSNEEK